jgi:hypothetical protein
MFVSYQLTLAVTFQSAHARLETLTHGRWLSAASGDAYADGLAGLNRVGLFGAGLGASKLVRVSLLEPVPREDVMILSLRWEATGVTGGLFPVLDADLTVTPADAGQTLMKVDGAYRAPWGAAGAALDRVLLGRAADATIRSLLTRIADAVANPSLGTRTAELLAPARSPVEPSTCRAPADRIETVRRCMPDLIRQ